MQLQYFVFISNVLQSKFTVKLANPRVSSPATSQGCRIFMKTCKCKGFCDCLCLFILNKKYSMVSEVGLPNYYNIIRASWNNIMKNCCTRNNWYSFKYHHITRTKSGCIIRKPKRCLEECWIVICYKLGLCFISFPSVHTSLCLMFK